MGRRKHSFIKRVATTENEEGTRKRGKGEGNKYLSNNITRLMVNSNDHWIGRESKTDRQTTLQLLRTGESNYFGT